MNIMKEERPYEKCLKYGAGVLTDSELLAVIIRTGTKGTDSIELSRQILKESKKSPGILGIMDLSIPELMKIKGIGKVKAIQISCIGELSRRISKQRAALKLKCNNPASIADYYMEDMRHSKREQLVVMFLDTKCCLIKDMVLSIGTVNASLVSPRELFIEALKYQAVSIILLHNHPSGDPSPSREDIQITKKVKACSDIIGIALIDHIIIGDNKYVSLKEQGII